MHSILQLHSFSETSKSARAIKLLIACMYIVSQDHHKWHGMLRSSVHSKDRALSKAQNNREKRRERETDRQTDRQENRREREIYI